MEPAKEEEAKEVMANDVFHYVPEMEARYPLEMERAGVALFDNLDTDAQEDIVQCVGNKLRFPKSDISKVLRGMGIPVWLVDPTKLIGDEGRSVRTEDVREYRRLLSRDLRSMPPVLIDSDSEAQEYPLCEGGHRTVAAIEEGLPRILAIDVGGVRIKDGGLKFRE